MNTQSSAIPESLGAQGATSAFVASMRPLYWSVRRELWEYRMLCLAPAGVAVVFLLGFLISLGNHVSFALGTTHQHDAVMGPYEMAAGIMMLTAILLSSFYCLDALYGERRDRSIVFWKSLPVSDLTTVLAKVSIPLVIVPVIASVVGSVLQLIMLLLSTAVMSSSGQSVAPLWREVQWFQMSLLLLYHILTAHALWPAPVFGWMLFVSAWARRAPFLWATLPVVAIAGVEAIAFRTAHFISFVGGRLLGYAAVNAGDFFPTNPMSHIHPGIFLTTVSLWGGLAVMAIFVVLAVKLRRRQGPI